MNGRLIFGLALALLVIPALLLSSAVALWFWYPPEFGSGALGPWLYDPRDAWHWWREWSHDEAFRAEFLYGSVLAFVPSAIALARAVMVLAYQRPLHLHDGTTDDAASFATVADIMRSGETAIEGDGLVIGREGAEVLRAVGDMHVLVVGPSGSGKTLGPIVCTLLELGQHSVACLDPKGELARMTGRYRAGLGPCFLFDPTNKYAAHYNPLLDLRQGEHLHSDCEMLATLIAIRGAANDPTWEEAAAELLTALLLVAFEHGSPTLAYVHRLVLQVSGGNYPKSSNPYVMEVLAAHRGLEDRVRSSVNFETRTCMKWMGDPIVREVTDRSDFRAGDLFVGDDPTTLFVSCPPAQQQRLSALMRLIYQVIMNTGLHDVTDLPDGREKTRRVVFIGEEVALLGKNETLKLTMNAGRGYGFWMLLCCQDLSQIFETFGAQQAITSNVGTLVIMPGFSGSLDKLEKWCGWTVHTRHSQGRDIWRPMSAHMEEAEERRPLLNPSDMLGNTRQSLVLQLGTRRPVWVDRVKVTDMARYRDLFDPLPRFGFIDRAAKRWLPSLLGRA